MSYNRDDHGMKSDGSGKRNRSQSPLSFGRFMNSSFISNGSGATSSTSHDNYRRRQHISSTRSHSNDTRHYENKYHSSNRRDSEGRNEQTRYSGTSNYNGKRHSTTYDSPPNKRSRLPPVSYPTLIKLIDKSSDDILDEMLHPHFQLNKFLNDQRMQERYDWVFSMTTLLEKITQCTGSYDRIVKIFEQIPDTRYLESIYEEVRKINPNTNQLPFKLIELFLKISNKFLDMIPHSADSLTKVFERLELQLNKNQWESKEFEVAKEILGEVLEKEQNRLNPKPANTTNSITTFQDNIDQYSQLPIIPDINEILSGQSPQLRKNIIDGVYENAEQYLDIHFRLLREDFVGPLRDGIQQYLCKGSGKNFNIRIYENIYSYGSKLVPRSGLVYDLLLDKTIVSKIHWAHSQRLKYGNLLLLTNDNFQSYTFVTVEDRSQVETRFMISVKVLKRLNINNQTQIDLDKIDSSHPLTMIETMTYFEAYRPVLNALQQIPSDNKFPLAPFLLKLKNEMTPPDYIKPQTTYDFTPLLVDPESTITATLNTDSRVIIHGKKYLKSIIKKELRINYKKSDKIEKQYKTVSVLNKDEWPTSEQLHLNPKQRDALMLALTNKVALIQGPPGTGKTFLGVRVAEMLLYNRSVWCPSGEQSTPILMICQTNHALDQFLEFIVKRLHMHDGIIRVGSRCQNETIQQFSLKNARQSARVNRSIPYDIFYKKHEILEKKIKSEQLLKLQQKKIEMTYNLLTSLPSFIKCSIIDDRHILSLFGSYYDYMHARVLLDWLGITNRYEQIPEGLIYEEDSESNALRMEINDDIEENQYYYNEDEEEDRRDESDIEENNDAYYSSSTVLKPECVTMNRTDGEMLSEYSSKNKKKRLDENHRTIKYIVQGRTTLNDETVKQINYDVWELPEGQRHELYRYWLLKYRQYLSSCVDDTRQEYNDAVSDFTEYHEEVDYYILKDSIIVAMTTTCAAKYHKVLEKLQSKIVIVEEAAAIFEAHIITALSTKCEHLILIGDHIQLRPTPNVYHLGVKYNIDVSLFERLIKNNFPNVRLNIQHRMRPEIACLMKHFYDDLKDHQSVIQNRPAIRGIDKNLFFINHNNPETNVDDGRSKRNEFEGNYAIELAQYLIKQRYEPKQITILVMYLGQKQYIIRLIKEKAVLHGVRTMVTDDYQGEENDIIILSLVRSNSEQKIGFLKTHNRICVALSRARLGLFVIGNMDLLAELDDKWKNIVTSLSETNNIGKGLSLSCRQHPEPKFIANKPESFAQRPEGGCKERCVTRLNCGHQCGLPCHNYDFQHEEIVCKKKCDEQLSCGHSCTKQCHIETPDQHNPCTVLVERTIPECGHTIHIKCYETLNLHNPCTVFVEKTIPECGHKIRVKCCETSNLHARCHVLVEKTIPECGHTIHIECCKTPTADDCKQSPLKKLPCDHIVPVPCRILTSSYPLEEFPCPEPCGVMLACKHKCVGKCADCHTGKLHVACGEKCERELICSHVCKVSCATNCPPCSRPCETRCIHSKCNKRCGDLCRPCREPCAYECKHLRCTRKCSEPCNRGPCNKPCTKKLRCGHTCIGMCGEPCPPKCRVCDKEIVQDIIFGKEDEPDARFVFLPDCKHIVEVTALDKFVHDFVNASNDKAAIRFPECPHCKQKILRCTRYTSILNSAYNLISEVKKKILGNKSEKEIYKQRQQVIEDYEKSKTKLEVIILNNSMKACFTILHEKNHLFPDTLNLIANIIVFLNEIVTILTDGRKKLQQQQDIFVDRVRVPLYHIVTYLFKQRRDRNFAEQQLNDIQCELKRIRRVIDFEMFVVSLKPTLNTNEQEGIDSMKHLITKYGPFTDQNREKFDDLFKQFKYLNNIPGLGINEDERLAIVTALNLKKGHWYACPKGHPYIITECGGANQESQCSECKEQIGGQRHTLLPSNSHFNQMDHSQHAAWSNEANLNIPLLFN